MERNIVVFDKLGEYEIEADGKPIIAFSKKEMSSVVTQVASMQVTPRMDEDEVAEKLRDEVISIVMEIIEEAVNRAEISISSGISRRMVEDRLDEYLEGLGG